jgi:hypothetical protein
VFLHKHQRAARDVARVVYARVRSPEERHLQRLPTKKKTKKNATTQTLNLLALLVQKDYTRTRDVASVVCS